MLDPVAEHTRTPLVSSAWVHHATLRPERGTNASSATDEAERDEITTGRGCEGPEKAVRVRFVFPPLLCLLRFFARADKGNDQYEPGECVWRHAGVGVKASNEEEETLARPRSHLTRGLGGRRTPIKPARPQRLGLVPDTSRKSRTSGRRSKVKDDVKTRTRGRFSLSVAPEWTVVN